MLSCVLSRQFQPRKVESRNPPHSKFSGSVGLVPTKDELEIANTGGSRSCGGRHNDMIVLRKGICPSAQAC